MGHILYKSGWLEQGGQATKPAQSANTAADAVASFFKSMRDTNYTVTWCQVTDGGNSYELTQIYAVKSTTSVGIGFYSTVSVGANNVSWSVCGYNA